MWPSPFFCALVAETGRALSVRVCVVGRGGALSVRGSMKCLDKGVSRDAKRNFDGSACF